RMSDQHDRRRRFAVFADRGIGNLVALWKIMDFGVYAGLAKLFSEAIHAARKDEAEDTADQIRAGERVWRARAGGPRRSGPAGPRKGTLHAAAQQKAGANQRSDCGGFTRRPHHAFQVPSERWLRVPSAVQHGNRGNRPRARGVERYRSASVAN